VEEQNVGCPQYSPSTKQQSNRLSTTQTWIDYHRRLPKPKVSHKTNGWPHWIMKWCMMGISWLFVVMSKHIPLSPRYKENWNWAKTRHTSSREKCRK